jgi:hypothetical protein
MRKKRPLDINLKRTARHTIMFNSREMNAIRKYCDQYKVANRSKFMRETIITTILRDFDKNYPSLFEDDHPTLFSRIQ